MKLIRGVLFVVALLAVALPGATRLAAQTSAQAEITALDPVRQNVNQIEGGARRAGLSISALDDFSRRLSPIRDSLRNKIGELEPRLAEIDERLKQLGPAPAKDAPAESPTIAAERARLDEAHSDLDAALKQARLLAARAEQIANSLADRRRSVYAQEMLEQSSSALSPFFWVEAASALTNEVVTLGLVLRTWWALVVTSGVLKLVSAVFLGVLLSASVIVVARWLNERAELWPRNSRLTKAIASLGVLARVAITVPLAVFVFLQAIESFGLRTQGWDEITTALSVAILVASVGRAVAIGVLAPEEPQRRLLEVDNDSARLLSRHMVWASRWFGLMAFLLLTHKAIGGSHPLTVATNMLFGFGTIGILLNLLLGQHALVLGTEEAPRNLWVRAVAWLVVVALAISLVLGYAGLAAFLAERVMVTLAVCGALYMLFVTADALFSAMAAGTPRGRALAAHLGIQNRRLGLIGTVLSGATFLTVVLVGIVLIVGPWGGSASDLMDSLRNIAFGIRIGDFNLSPGTILSGILLLVFVLFVARLIQRWLETQLLPHTDLEPSLRQSIATMCGYLGVIIAIVLTLAHLGIDPQKIALVAGALSVGIGFGLQSIVSNFVSGLILLAERPIRVGDLINVKGDEGRVRKISVRATEIETGERSSVIIPNSELITGVVKNRTRGDDTTLTKITLSVAYGSDPEQVRGILLACARENTQIMQRPEPSVLLVNFAESGLSFELNFVCVDVNTSGSVASDVRFAILRRLEEEKIEIPYPQRELRWRDEPAPKSKPPRKRKRA